MQTESSSNKITGFPLSYFQKIPGLLQDFPGPLVRFSRTLSQHSNVCMYVSFGQGSSLLWTHTLRPFYSRPIALTQEGRSQVNDVCEGVRD